jgi:hypothetical protein
VENSGHDLANWLDNLSERTQARINFESYTETADLGGCKGAGEGLMYDRVAQRLESDLGHVTDIVKCTGRLTLRSRSGVPGAPHMPRYVMSRISRDLTRMDTRIFGVDKETFVQHFTGLAPAVDEGAGVYLEHVVCRATLTAISQGVARLVFQPLPLLNGVSGSTGSRYRGLRTLMSVYTQKLDVRVSGNLV